MFCLSQHLHVYICSRYTNVFFVHVLHVHVVLFETRVGNGKHVHACEHVQCTAYYVFTGMFYVETICVIQYVPHSQSAATVYSPYDGVVKEIVVPVDEIAYLEKPLVIFEVEDDNMTGNVVIMCLLDNLHT